MRILSGIFFTAILRSTRIKIKTQIFNLENVRNLKNVCVEKFGFCEIEEPRNNALNFHLKLTD